MAELSALSESALACLFSEAVLPEAWLNDRAETEDAVKLWELLKKGPTIANCSPARFAFLQSNAAKEKLRPALSPGSADKILSAAAVVIVAKDPCFYNRLPYLYPAAEVRPWFLANPDFAAKTATENTCLQAGYLIMAARALGFDCLPFSGFRASLVDRLFFGETNWQSELIVIFGKGLHTKPAASLPALSFQDVCQVL